jgi:tyrosinase
VTAGSLIQLSRPEASTCQDPPIRREWRSLNASERSEFTQAVNCLATVPSRWRGNGTIYDDFAFLHGGIGSWCLCTCFFVAIKPYANTGLQENTGHRSASFLPWHRYTLLIYENALRKHCGFTGQIPCVFDSLWSYGHHPLTDE